MYNRERQNKIAEGSWVAVPRSPTWECWVEEIFPVAKKAVSVEPIDAAQKEVVRIYEIITNSWEVTWKYAMGCLY